MRGPWAEGFSNMSEIERNKPGAHQREIYLLLAIIIFALLLRLFRLAYQSFWTDEIITIKASQNSVAQLIVHPTTNNNMPPLYFLMTHFLLKIDHHNPELLLRFPSMLFGVLSVAVFYFIVKRFLGSKVSLVATAFMAISPFHIWYSQEARPYSLLLFLSLLSIWLLQELISNPHSSWRQIGFVGSVVLTFYCHTIAIAFIGALFIYVLMFYFKIDWKYWSKIIISIIILMVPALLYLMLNPPAAGGDPHRTTNILSSLAYTLWTFSTGFSLGPSLSEWHDQDKLKILQPHIHFILPIMLLVSMLFLVGTAKLYKNDKKAFWFAILLFICPLLLGIVGSFISSVHPFNVRYSIISYPAFIILIAFGLIAIKNFKVHSFAFGSLVLICVLSLNNYYFHQKYHREDNRSAGQFLKTHAMGNDLVICSAGYTASNLRYYCSREDIHFIGYPAKYQLVDPVQIKSDFDKIIAERDRFWLFLSRTFHSDPHGHIIKYCNENFYAQELHESIGVKLICYQKASELE